MQDAPDAGGTSAPLVKVDERTFTQIMEQLQESYVAAVAATAGVDAAFTRRDLFKADVEFKRQPSVSTEPVPVRAQLKATTTHKFTRASGTGEECLSFQFKTRKDFDSLVMKRRMGKQLLIVMVVGRDQHAWTEATHDQLVTRHCCYWVNLEGETADLSVDRPTVQVPLSQIFDASAITGILDRVERGERI